MENSVNKMIMIGVSLFVTIIITTGVIGVVNSIKNVYKQVYNTDTNLSSRFNEFTKYENSNKSGLDMINTANKYYDDTLVIVEYRGTVLNSEAGINYLNIEVESERITYDSKVYSTVETVTDDGVEKTKILFVDR